MKISFIATVLNEEKRIDSFVRSVLSQSKRIEEIIIVDGGSKDNTLKVLNRYKDKVRIILKKGNRSVGRNEAIKNSSSEIIVCSDAGCILDKNWVKNIIEPFIDPKVDLVAGYYRGKPNSVFEKCLIPYVLVMPDKVNPDNFLPASRSMAFKKSLWEKIGKFPEEFSNNEDYAFAKKLKECGANIFFQKDAIVNWIPRKNIKESFTMFFRFALGDSEAGIIRSKVILIFSRYILGLYLLLLSFIEKSSFLFFSVILGVILYAVWSAFKNYKYVKNYAALLFLPILQLTSDMAVLIGTTVGLLKQLRVEERMRSVGNNKPITAVILIYIFLMLSLITWGIPNKNHPFNYVMDEWHQLQAVRAVFTHGSPNISGAAHGTIFHFILSGFYLIPFVAAHIVNPFAIKSSIDLLDVFERLFIILRLNTLLFGISSIIVLWKILKDNFQIKIIYPIVLFVFNPLWLVVSNYFKYDIALIFWILMAIFFLLRFARDPTLRNYILAGFFCSISLAVKISAVPFLPLYIFAFYFFPSKEKRKKLHLFYGLLVFIATFLILGIPDLLFGKGKVGEFIYSNLIGSPNTSSNFILGYKHWLPYILFRIIPNNFGYAFYALFIISLIYTSSFIFGKRMKDASIIYKNYLYIFVCFMLFFASVMPLKIYAAGNRLLVLLPFFAIFVGFFIDRIFIKLSLRKKIIAHMIFSVVILIQLVQSLPYVFSKWQPDPRKTSSQWIIENVQKGSVIGIENIPIYQYLPDIAILEIYSKKENKNFSPRYVYQIVNAHSRKLPRTVIITGREMDMKYLKKSPKKDLLIRLGEEKYVKVVEFSPPNILYKVMGNDLDLYASGIVPMATITVFKK